MSESMLEQELLRCRWRRSRRRLGLLAPNEETFGAGGLVSKLDDPSVRMLILPRDPERRHLRFEASLWEFFLENRPKFVTGQPDSWGGHRPTTECMVHFDPIYDAADHWRRYLALDRSGGLELGLGSSGAFEVYDHRTFQLIPIVASAWAALNFYREVVVHLKVDGPWELSLAMLNTKNAWLGAVAEGWAEPSSPMARDSSRECMEPGLLFQQELANWPDPDGLQDLAFSLGGWLEDCWGFRERRFLAGCGPRAGTFAISRYRGR